MIDSGIQESINAQTSILKDIITGQQPDQTETMPSVEQKLRGYIHKYAKNAYSELTTLGLNADNLRPITNGETVTLNTNDQAIIMNHLLKVFGLQEKIQMIQNRQDPDGFQMQWELKKMLDSLKNDVNITVSGPVIAIEFKSPRAMDLFRFARGKNSLGMASYFPLDIVEGKKGKTWNTSKTTFLSLVDSQETSKITGHDAHAHEHWHIIDNFRRAIYAQEQIEQIGRKIDALYEQNSDRFIQRLTDFLFDPKDLSQSLLALQQTMPEIYNYYIGAETSPEILKGNLLTIQNELSAWIAGYTDPENPQGITDEQVTDVVNHVMNYFVLSTVNKESILLLTDDRSETPDKVNDESIEMTFNPRAVQLGEPPKEKIAMLDVYSIREGWASKRNIHRKKEFVEHMQKVLDDFVNEGGYFTQCEKQLRDNLTKAIQSFRSLAQHRNNPHQALLELSLLPLSHWEMYTTREQRS